MLYLYLTLSHLIGDFILQPNKLIAWKNKSVIGTLVHVIILFIVNLFFLVPYFGVKGFFLGLFLIYLIHLIEDIFKIEYVKKYPKSEFAAFIFDQAVHFTAFTILYFYLSKATATLNNSIYNFLYSSYLIPIFLLICVLSTYVYDIVEFEVMRIKNPGLAYCRNYKKMFIRFVFSASIFFLILLLQKFI